MKKRSIFLVMAAVVALVFSSCTKISQGTFGVKTHEYGSKKGEVEILGPGLYANHWFGKYHIYKYPANVQQHSWVRTEDEKYIYDNRLQFQAEGQTLTAAIGIEYEFSADEAERRAMYVYFKRTPQEIEEDFMRKDLVSALNKVSQNLTVEEVYSSKKDSVRLAVQEIMKAKYATHGIIINEVTYMSPVEPPKIVKDAIDAKIAATQEAQKRENEIAAERAEAQKKVEKARGEAESMRIAAEGRAKAMDIEGAALRRNPQIIDLKRVENQGVAAKSAEHWSSPVLSAQQTQMLLGLGGGK